MNPRIHEYIQNSFADFKARELALIKGLTLEQIVDLNPYLLKAKHTHLVHEIVENWLQAYLLTIENAFLIDLLKGVAILVAEHTRNGRAATLPGIDLECMDQDTYYLVSLTLWPNWNNAGHIDRQQQLEQALAHIQPPSPLTKIQGVFAACYGNNASKFEHGYLYLAGQNFWYWLSGDPDFYQTLFEAIYRLREPDALTDAQNALINRLTLEFFRRFCEPNGKIDWPRLVEFNSGNLDLNESLAKPGAA